MEKIQQYLKNSLIQPQKIFQLLVHQHNHFHHILVHHPSIDRVLHHNHNPHQHYHYNHNLHLESLNHHIHRIHLVLQHHHNHHYNQYLQYNYLNNHNFLVDIHNLLVLQYYMRKHLHKYHHHQFNHLHSTQSLEQPPPPQP